MLLGAFLHCASFGCIWVRSSSSSGGRRLDGALGLDGTAAAAVLGRSAEADVSWTLLLLQHPHPRLTGWQLPGVSDKIGAGSDNQASKWSLMRRESRQWVGTKKAHWEREGESEERDNGFKSQLRRLLWTVHRGIQVGSNFSSLILFYPKFCRIIRISERYGCADIGDISHCNALVRT